jgi:2-desacetyl-2-hydroxyethyl bacteriochlorophyllide A dehydrogenase
MPSWLVTILGAVYTRIPQAARPPLKRAFRWAELRVSALVWRRSVEHGRRVEFLDFEIAYLGPYEFLGPGPRDVLVEALASCVSPGTERAVLMGLPGARRQFPYVPGYSVAGRVTAVGKSIDGIVVGDLVAGRMSHASRGVMSSASLFKVPDGVSAAQASFIEIGIITLQGIRKAAIRPGDRVAVIGQGLIGALAVRVARAVGADPIVAVASSRRRMGPALAAGGADEFLSLAEQPGRVADLNAEIVIEAVGSASAVTTAMKAARPGGTVVLLGSSRDLGRSLDWWSLAQQRNLTLLGAHIGDMPSAEASSGRWTYRQEGQLFLDLLESGRLNVSDLVTWTPRPDDCNEVYEVLAEGGRQHVGIVFRWADSTAVRA